MAARNGRTARNDNYYRARNRNKGRASASEIDAIAVAMTAQIVICVIVLLLALAAKKADEDGYSDMKSSYQNLVGSESEGVGDYFNRMKGMGEGFFSSVENLINRLFGREEQAPDTQTPPPVDDTMPEEQDAFGYSYLPEEMSGAAGGIMPTQLGNKALAPPAWATYAPVALNGKIQSPVTGLVTSQFAYREHPITGKSDFHNGMDIASPEGRGVLAALPGEVWKVGSDDIYGNYIILSHATNLKTFYAHCSEIIATEGMKIKQGERIAKVGQTGMATGPHLHFSVIVDETYVDPGWVLSDNLVLVEE